MGKEWGGNNSCAGAKSNLHTKNLDMKNWISIVMGCCIVAIGFVIFINPYGMVPGGVYGSSIVLHSVWPALQVGTYSYFMQIPLMLLSVLLLGKKLGARTLFVVLFTPLVMNALSYLCYPTAEALQSLSPKELLGGSMDLSDHLILAALFGGLCVGGGSGLIIRSQAGTGGTDLVAMMLQKYAHIRFSRAILVIDGLIILCGMLVSGSGLMALYSLVAIFALNFALNFTLNGQRDSKIIYIICKEGASDAGDRTKKVYDYILHELDYTATCIPCRGLYSNSSKEMLMMVVHDKMVPSITQSITRYEPEAFLIVADAYNTYGLRWSKFPTKDDLMLG